jgi:DNA-binding CsgD family transcriptional regulator
MALDVSRALLLTFELGEAAKTLQTAIEELDGRDRELELRLTAELLGTARLDRETRPLALEVLARVEVPEQASTPAERILLAQVAAEASATKQPAAEAAALAERGLGGGALLAEEGPESLVLCYAATALTVADRLEEGCRVLHDAIDEARRRGSALGFAHLTNVLADAHYRMGALADAEADARHGLEVVGTERWDLDRHFFLKNLLDVLIERGELDEAEGELERHGAASGPIVSYIDNMLSWTRGRLRMAQGRPREAADELLACGQRQEAWGVRSPAMLPWRSSAAEALIMAGEPAKARELAREELALARSVQTGRAIGIALRAAGIAAEGDEQIALFEEAADVLEPSPARLEHGRALTDLGAALRRSNRRADARAALERGLDLAHTCGATALVDRAHTELLAAGSRPRRLALEGRDALTPSERRVAEIAAEGRTNREVAQALFITVKTVEMHLARAYRKLGIGSRAELADSLQGSSPEPD